jgi:hypothetical protein
MAQLPHHLKNLITGFLDFSFASSGTAKSWLFEWRRDKGTTSSSWTESKDFKEWATSSRPISGGGTLFEEEDEGRSPSAD